MDRWLGEHGIPKDSPAGRRVFEEWMEQLRRGWCLGEEVFRKELLAQVSGRRGARHDGAELQKGDQEKAERWVKQEWARGKWSDEDLAGEPKTVRPKARLGWRLRRQTTMRLAWMARRLQKGRVNTLKTTLPLAHSRDCPHSLNRRDAKGAEP